MKRIDGGGVALRVSDVSRQKTAHADVPREATVGEIVRGFLNDLRLPDVDPDGNPLAYHALLEREARHVHASERVGDALQPGDRLTLQPSIEAGGPTV